MIKILLLDEIGLAAICAVGAGLYATSHGMEAALRFFLVCFIVPQPFILYTFRHGIVAAWKGRRQGPQ